MQESKLEHMWELLSPENKNKIKEGIIIMRYPMMGEAEEAVPADYDEDEGIQYCVHTVDPDIKQIRLTLPSQSNTNNSTMNINQLIMLNKNYDEMVEGKNWWIPEEK